MSDARAERAARNEAIFREANERISEVTEAQRESFAQFFCECSDTACTERIDVSLAEYEAVRARGARFALIVGHEDPRVERVVERTDRYVVVEKFGRGAEVAEELDPRS